MNILLIYPPFPETFWSYAHALRIIRKRAMLPPLGLLTVAAMLPSHWGKRLVDTNVSRLKAEDLAWADCVFISGMAVQRHSARQVIARCKAAGKIVVAGGPLFTGEYALFEQVDHFVLNEAELTLPPFLSDFEKGCANRVYRTRQYADLRQSPVPMWELADLSKYASASVQYSRGCPYNCEFCNVTALLGRSPRVKSSGQVIAELDRLRGAGWRGAVFFVDDNLIGHRPAVKGDLLPALIRWQRAHGSTSFLTQVSINLADDQGLVRMMVEAGFDMVFTGIETPDSCSLTECGKSQNTNRDLVADVKRLQRAGLEVQGGFIVGFDHDTPSIFQRQVEFIQQSGIVTAMVGLLQAPPGTRLLERLRVEGRLLGPASGDNGDGTTNFLPTMGIERLREGYRSLLKGIYSPRPYYQRIRVFLREYKGPKNRMPVNVANIGVFVRSIFHLGIVGQERIEYWALLAWTLLKRPTLLPTAVRLAIYGYHYRKMCED